MHKNHETCGIACKHANMSYCEHCKVPYCKDCKTEWRNYFNSGAISMSTLPYYDRYGVSGGSYLSNTVQIEPASLIKCDH